MVLLVKRDDVELSSFISVGGCDIIFYDICSADQSSRSCLYFKLSK